MGRIVLRRTPTQAAASGLSECETPVIPGAVAIHMLDPHPAGRVCNQPLSDQSRLVARLTWRCQERDLGACRDSSITKGDADACHTPPLRPKRRRG